MESEVFYQKSDDFILQQDFIVCKNLIPQKKYFNSVRKNSKRDIVSDLTEILFLTSYPPRECGIATYSQDLIRALKNQFCNSFSIKVCALESGFQNFSYPGEVKYVLNTSVAVGYSKLAKTINNDDRIKIVLIQHEFGLFREQEQSFLQFLYELSKPIVIVFHSVLPYPDEQLRLKVKCIETVCDSFIVMTQNSSEILMRDYDIPRQKISIIAHGIHLIPHLNKAILKEQFGFKNRKVLSTFGLLSLGKSIETTLEALPDIVKKFPEIIFLVIGKTHPQVVIDEGEKYRESLEKKVNEYALQNHVVFINEYLGLSELLKYLQMTDIYLFTSSDPNQAVSGTFSYAMSCACPIISTPIPHSKEVLTEDTGIIFDFRNSRQLADSVIKLLNDEPLRRNLSINTLQKIVSTAWENSAIAHSLLFEKLGGNKIKLNYNFPSINLDHLKQMTNNTGIIQFSKINQPDIESGYTLDDNARALVASCMYYLLNRDEDCVDSIHKYLDFIRFCQQPTGNFLNYVDKDNKFTDQNKTDNLDDANGRAIWALGYVELLTDILPNEIISMAGSILRKSLNYIEKVNSTRAMAFAIKGIFYDYSTQNSHHNIALIETFADRLVQMYRHESTEKWKWFEGYLTYANSILPEAMLYAWLLTGKVVYHEIAISTLDFLLSKIFIEDRIEVITNKNWLQRGEELLQKTKGGEQPIDVAYTIMTLDKFYEIFQNEEYHQKIETAFNWFLGNNNLHQTVYNPCTGGCYDGLEETHVNLNQGAESTISYLMARLTVEKYNNG